MTISELFDKHYDNLNDNDVYIYDFILKNKLLCEHLSITELSLQCHISKSTILRFCQRLGLKGYSEFKTLLSIENSTIIKPSTSCINDSYQCYHKYLDELSKKDFSSIIERIDQAENLYVLGSGDFQDSAAMELKRSFLQVHKMFLPIESNQEFEVYEHLIQENDVIIIISYSGENKKIIEFAKALHIKHVSIISITTQQSNTLAKLSNEQLYLPSIHIQPNVHYEGFANYFMLIDFLVLNYIDYHREELAHE